ncbi:MerR family transcriptional regulator [Corynebacterium urinipleomorphum]|uniref:MerR family transcriptional regulator n=1 Tax=Corynebacterium urinipleomorphum TaxID=1852380 RepID=UPI000B353171|nr:MerR family transcriptional regulator [Corynebacterium urinipleomorphum]
MGDYTIGEAAAMLGVTTKALRHWETLGLLEPRRTSAGYRTYGDADIERGAAIALYRGVGVPLDTIARLIDAPSHTLRTALARHRAELAAQLHAVAEQLDVVDALIEQTEKGHIDMDAMKKYLGDEMPEYQAEAEERWGDTAEWAQSQEKLAHMGEDDFAQLQREQDAFADDLVAARDAGVEAGSDEAEALVARHREMIGQWYDVTPARQLILARMYVGDERFHDAYNGAQEYLLGIVEKHAAAQGVDTANPQW